MFRSASTYKAGNVNTFLGECLIKFKVFLCLGLASYPLARNVPGNVSGNACPFNADMHAHEFYVIEECDNLIY